MGQAGNSIQVLVLVAQTLAERQVAGVVLHSSLVAVTLLLITRGGDLTVVLQQLLEELGTKDRDLGEEQLALNQSRVGVVQHSPDRDKIIQLAASLLDDTVLALQDNGHAGQILDLSVADDKTVNVEATSSQDTGHTGQDTGLVLDQAVQDVALGRVGRRNGSLVQNRRDSSRGVPLGRSLIDRQGKRGPAVQCLVGQGGSRAGRGTDGGETGQSGSGARPSSSCSRRQSRR